MPFNRRTFMAGIGVAAGAGLIMPRIKSLSASAPAKIQGQVPGIYRTRIGQVEVTSIFDGGMEMGPAIINSADTSEVNRLKEKAFLPKDIIPGYLNTFVINSGGKLTLIDTGYGSGTPLTGHLLSNLQAAGFAPEQIDEILLTHAHPDHVSGLTDKSGQPVFSRAVVKLAEEEMSFWFDDTQKNRFSDKAAMFDAARNTLSPYKALNRIETFKIGSDLKNGISSVDLRGHTPGHSGYRISDGNDQLLIWGDIIHMQALQFTHPEWTLIFDIDPQQAQKTRAKILDEVSRDRIRIGGMHLSFPGLGHVEKSQQRGYALVPQQWEWRI